MNVKEREFPTSTYQILEVLEKHRNETATSLENEELKKGKRKSLKRIIKVIDKINEGIKECNENTGNREGLTITIARGKPDSKKVQTGEYVVKQIAKSSEPTETFGTLKNRYSIKYYPTIDENIFIEDTLHQTKVQEQRKIRLVGVNILEKRRINN